MTKTAWRLAITADLHWGVRDAGDAATRLLLANLYDQPPDLLVLVGDVGAGDDFERCLELFDQLSCRKALVPGNHDIWVAEADGRGDSLTVYREYLPGVCARHDFAYLDQAPLVWPEAGLAVAGSINWYDYSWSIDKLPSVLPDWEERLRTKRFSRGRHNDGRFVRWPLDDARFTAEVVATLERHLEDALRQVPKALVIAHHPPFYGLNFPRPAEEPINPDALLWDAFSGNRAVEAVLTRHAARIPFAFCGHTHRARENTWHGIRGHNIGGDYHFKRLLNLHWPEGRVEANVFGDP
jgi:3',5'-cyclic AMP phosphodiesterase CpdA